IGDQRQPFRALLLQRLDQVERRAGHGEAAEADHAAVRNIRHGLGKIAELLGPLTHAFPRVSARMNGQAWAPVKVEGRGTACYWFMFQMSLSSIQAFFTCFHTTTYLPDACV